MIQTSLAYAVEYAARSNNKVAFHRFARTCLTRLAVELNLATKDRDIRACKGGPAVLGEAILHSDEFYIWIHQGGVLFRTCNGRKDYTGDVNHNWSHTCLRDLHTMALKMRGVACAKAYAQKH